MKQARLGLNLSTKKTRKREFLEEMERVAPWKVLVEIIEPYWPKSKTGRPPFAIETMLRIHYMQQWFGLSDPAMEEALHDVPLYWFEQRRQPHSRRDDDLALSPLAREARPRGGHASRGQPTAAEQGLDAQDRHGGGCGSSTRSNT